MKKLFFILIFLFLPVNNTLAAEDAYLFSKQEQQKRFLSLTAELRCLVCQNQNLAESNAPLANDLRQQIYLQINQGQSDKQIIEYLTSRYGKFILYRPPLNITTIILWLGPFILLLIASAYLFIYIYKRQKRC